MELEKEYSCLSKNDLVFCKSIGIDKNYQETPEAYLDDISKVVKCTSHSYVTSCDIKDSTVYIAGKTEICLTYYNESKELLYTDFVEDFNENIAIEKASEYAFSFAKVCNKYCNFRLINQRRIDIHTAFALNVSVYDKKSCPCLNKCDHSKLRTFDEKIAYVENAIISKIDVEESFSLPSNSNGIKRVVSFETNVSSIELKTIKDKALVKSSICLNVLYTDNDNSISRAEFTFETSKIVEIAGVDEKCSCIADITMGSLYVKAKSTSDNSGGKIELYGDFSLSVVVVKEETNSVVADGYIIGQKTKNNYSKFDCLADGNYNSVENSTKLSLDLSVSVLKIIDFTVKAGECSIKNQKLSVDFEVCILAETTEHSLEYIAMIKTVESKTDNAELAASAFVSSYDYTIVNEKNISVNVLYTYCSYSGKAKSIGVLSEMECLDDVVSYPALTLYFAKQNEKIWDIAKQFSSDTELIKKENNITCDCLDGNKVIIIPGL